MKKHAVISLKNSRSWSLTRVAVMLMAMFVVVGITGCLNSSSPVRGNITGKVFDSNGKVLHEARVEVYGANQSVLTDELGRYTITNVEPG